MGIDKKKVVAIIVFIFFGLFMFAFANPNEGDLKPAEDSVISDNTEDNTNTNNNNNNDNRNTAVITNNTVVGNAPTITLGTNVYSIEVGEDIPEFTAYASDNGVITITNNIDNTKVGTYEVVFTATNESGTSTVTVEFTVVDTTKPVITLLDSEEDNSVVVRKNNDYKELGAKAEDNYDGDISKNIVIDDSNIDVTKKGTYEVTYNVTDESGNEANEVTRSVSVVDADQLDSAIEDANSILTETEGLDVSSALNDLLQELDEESSTGSNIYDDLDSTQDVVDNQTDKINQVIELIRGLKFTVTYVDFNGNVLNTQIVKFMENAVAPEHPSRAGYNNTGWSSNGEKVVNDLTITALYTAGNSKYTVRYVHSSGSVDVLDLELIEDDTYTTDEEVTLSDDVILEHQGEGFTYNESKSTINGVVNGLGTLELTVYYERNSYKLTTVVDDKETTTTKLYKASLDLQDIEKTGYTFNGWYNEEKTLNELTLMPASDLTLYAKFTANTYTVSFDADNGILDVNEIKVTYDDTYGTLPVPTRDGYTFNGWYNGKELVSSTDTVKITEDTTLVASWTANTNTLYTVNYYLEELNSDEYKLDKTDNLEGTTDTVVTPEVKEYVGFTAPDAQEVNVDGDGSTVVNYYYTRNSYTLTVNAGTGIYRANGSGTYEYGETITVTYGMKVGYNTPVITDGKFTFTMPATDKEVTVSATPNNNTKYVVEYYKQNIENDEYTLNETVNLTGTTNTKVTPEVKAYEGFTAPDAKTVTIAGNGSTVVEYYYTRNSYTLTATASTGIESVSANETYRYGEKVTLDIDVKAGYSNVTVSGDETTTEFTMPAKDVNVEVSASANTNTEYVVKHYLQNINDDYYTEDVESIQTLTGTTDTEVTPEVKSYEGFTSPDTKTVKVLGNQTTIVMYYYTRNSYQVNVTKGTGITSVSGEGTYKYGANVTIGYELEDGYSNATITGTKTSSTFTMPANEVNVSVAATADTDTPYVVVYKYQNANDNNYEEIRVAKTGTTNTTVVAPEAKAGFVTPTASTATINGNGSTVVEYVYNRNTHSVVVTAGANVTEVTGSGTYKYGQTVNISGTAKTGYGNVTVTGDKTTSTFTMPDNDVNVTLSATANTNTTYVVKHLQQNLDNDEYTEVEADRQNLTGTTDSVVKPAVKSYTGFNSPAETEVSIAGDGSTVVEYKYSRKTYTFNKVYKDNKKDKDHITNNVKYGVALDLSYNKTGYTITWYTDKNHKKLFTGTTMPDHDLTIYGVVSKAKYTVTYTGVTGTNTENVEYDQNANLNNFSLDDYSTNTDNYEFIGWSTKENDTKKLDSLKVTSDVTLYPVYEKSTRYYTVTFMNGTTKISEEKTTYEGTVNAPSNPTKTGYRFDGWDKDYSKVTSNLTVNANWVAVQTGISVEEKNENIQLEFKKGTQVNIGDYINVYAVYGDGSKVLVTDYTTNFTTANATSDWTTLVVTETVNGKTYTDNSLKFKIIEEQAYQTKFEVNLVTSYTYTNKKCTVNCDQGDNVSTVDLDYNALEIIEHYDELIKVTNVVVTYEDGSSIDSNGWYGDYSNRLRYSREDYYGNLYDPMHLFRRVDYWYGYDYYKDVDTENNHIKTVKIYYNKNYESGYSVTFTNYNGTFKATGK